MADPAASEPPTCVSYLPCASGGSLPATNPFEINSEASPAWPRKGCHFCTVERLGAVPHHRQCDHIGAPGARGGIAVGTDVEHGNGRVFRHRRHLLDAATGNQHPPPVPNPQTQATDRD
jgi:hypothetical protein